MACSARRDKEGADNRRRPTRLGILTRIREVFACYRETRQWLRILCDYTRARSLPYPYEVQTRRGGKVTLLEHVDTVVFWMMFARHHYPVVSADKVIVDIGANIGMFTLYAATTARGARIVAVEPFPDTYSRLNALIDANLVRDRVTTLNCAVSGSSGTQKMDSAASIPSQYRRIHAPATATMNADHRGTAACEGTGGVEVRTETIERVFDIANVITADLVKINIHGSEYEVLLSADPAVLRRCRRIAVQYHEMPAEMHLGKQQLIDHLGKIGFTLISDHDTHRGAGLAVFAA